MTVGIIGLGLIGGSLAKAFCREEGNTVLGWDTDSTIVEFAQIAQAIHGSLSVWENWTCCCWPPTLRRWWNT